MNPLHLPARLAALSLIASAASLATAQTGQHAPASVASSASEAASAPAPVAVGATLSTIEVRSDTGADDALAPSTTRERRRLETIPGGSNLSELRDETRLGTLRDAVGYLPGVVLQDFSGGIDQPRFNIRGSGIQSNPISRGVLLLQDDLPLNEADGSFIIGTLEPRESAWLSVLRGTNARNAAANAFGGEVDFRSLTGRDETGRLRLEAGADGRYGWHLARGGSSGRLDGRISVSGDDYDGWRHHSSSQRRALRANFGFTGDNGFENRTYVSWTDLRFQIPFLLPADRVRSQPRSVLGEGRTAIDRTQNVLLRDPQRDVHQWRVANRSAWRNGDLSQTLGLYHQQTDDRFKNLLIDTPTQTRTSGAQWSLASQALGFDYRLLLAAEHSNTVREFYPVAPQTGVRLARLASYEMGARNLHAGIDLSRPIAADLTLVSTLRFTRASRDARNLGTGAALDQDYSFSSPRLGVNWRASDSTRWFANVAVQHEAPTFWEIVSSEVPVAAPLAGTTALNRLRAQRAQALEIGGSGHFGPGLAWDATVYRSIIRDELIATTDVSGIRVGTYNYAGDTRHQGLELGLRGELPNWRYRLAWTFSDFRFKDGALAGRRIAGVPRHLVNAELMRRDGAWEYGANVLASPSSAPIDHVNTRALRQRPYTVWGLKVVYHASPQWMLYAQVDNLMNRRYASSYVTRYEAAAGQPTFTTGVGRNLSAGLAYKF